MANWRKVWYVTFGLMLFETIFYVIFGSGQEQPWNKMYENQDSEELVEKEKSDQDTILKKEISA